MDKSSLPGPLIECGIKAARCLGGLSPTHLT